MTTRGFHADNRVVRRDLETRLSTVRQMAELVDQAGLA